MGQFDYINLKKATLQSYHFWAEMKWQMKNNKTDTKYSGLRKNFKKLRLYSRLSLIMTSWQMLELQSHIESSWLIFVISETFPMRYCMILYLKEYQKYGRSKLKSFIFTW